MMSYVNWPPLIFEHTYYMAEFETTLPESGAEGSRYP